MDLGMKGRVAVVAAASKGLGLAAATALANEGARIAICSRSTEQIALAAEKIRSRTGAEVLAESVDVREESQVKAFFAKTYERWKRIDICVTNSGGPPSKLFSETQTEDWRAAVDQLLMSTVFFAREALPPDEGTEYRPSLRTLSKQPVDGSCFVRFGRGYRSCTDAGEREYAAYELPQQRVRLYANPHRRIENMAERRGIAMRIIAEWKNRPRRSGTGRVRGGGGISRSGRQDINGASIRWTEGL
jgi:NAD(P)-dependent dehydrogenase (short-subunit alcohol dehydrogenase family)